MGALALALLLFIPSPVHADEHEAVPSRLARADAAWAERGRSLDASGLLAEPAAIESAIALYEQALATAPDSLEARWKLLRALHYSIDFAAPSEEAKEASATAAIELARQSVDLLDASESSDADRARVLFWSSIAWGTRASRVGLLTLVREGVARRMHDQAEQSLALDPRVDQGGALRLLARLHGTLPRVPFVSGWVDRDKALPYAERAVALDPSHPGSRLVLALTLLDLESSRADEARAALEAVAALEPRAAFVVEDLSIREQARERLATLTAGEGSEGGSR